MATWTRSGTGTAPAATDADLVGSYALDKGGVSGSRCGPGPEPHPGSHQAFPLPQQHAKNGPAVLACSITYGMFCGQSWQV